MDPQPQALRSMPRCPYAATQWAGQTSAPGVTSQGTMGQFGGKAELWGLS